jgi:integrase
MFPPPRGGRLNPDYLRKIVRRAMKDAKVPLVDGKGRQRKPWHSLRATYEQRMIRAGRHPEWVRRQLGHSDPSLTLNVYGEWSEAALRAEAAK